MPEGSGHEAGWGPRDQNLQGPGPTSWTAPGSRAAASVRRPLGPAGRPSRLGELCPSLHRPLPSRAESVVAKAPRTTPPLSPGSVLRGLEGLCRVPVLCRPLGGMCPRECSAGDLPDIDGAVGLDWRRRALERPSEGQGRGWCGQLERNQGPWLLGTGRSLSCVECRGQSEMAGVSRWEVAEAGPAIPS